VALTKISAGVIAANAVVDSFGTQSITGDKIGLTAINANNIVNSAITGPKFGANSVSSNNIVSVSGSAIIANTIANSAIQTGAIENYMAASGQPLSNRNIIINGDMRIAQRSTSNTGMSGDSAYHTADRWKLAINTKGTWTMNVEINGRTNSEFS